MPRSKRIARFESSIVNRAGTAAPGRGRRTRSANDASAPRPAGRPRRAPDRRTCSAVAFTYAIDPSASPSSNFAYFARRKWKSKLDEHPVWNGRRRKRASRGSAATPCPWFSAQADERRSCPPRRLPKEQQQRQTTTNISKRTMASRRSKKRALTVASMTMPRTAESDGGGGGCGGGGGGWALMVTAGLLLFSTSFATLESDVTSARRHSARQRASTVAGPLWRRAMGGRERDERGSQRGS